MNKSRNPETKGKGSTVGSDVIVFAIGIIVEALSSLKTTTLEVPTGGSFSFSMLMTSERGIESNSSSMMPGASEIGAEVFITSSFMPAAPLISLRSIPPANITEYNVRSDTARIRNKEYGKMGRRRRV